MHEQRKAVACSRIMTLILDATSVQSDTLEQQQQPKEAAALNPA